MLCLVSWSLFLPYSSVFFLSWWETDLEKLENCRTWRRAKKKPSIIIATLGIFNQVRVCACVFSASHDDRPGQGWGDLHEKEKKRSFSAFGHCEEWRVPTVWAYGEWKEQRMDEPIQLIQPQFRGSALQRSDTHSGHVTFISQPLGAVVCALL